MTGPDISELEGMSSMTGPDISDIINDLPIPQQREVESMNVHDAVEVLYSTYTIHICYHLCTILLNNMLQVAFLVLRLQSFVN